MKLNKCSGRMRCWGLQNFPNSRKWIDELIYKLRQVQKGQPGEEDRAVEKKLNI